MKIVKGWLLSAATLMAVEVGTIPPKVTIGGENGGRTDGKAWHSQMLQGKVYVLFYVDPDKKDVNEPFVQALKKHGFNHQTFGTVAVVNMAATWKPNVVIEALLKQKQKEFPDTTYVRDKKSVLVKRWKLADNESDVLIFDKRGRLIYKKFGKLSSKEIRKAIALIDKHL